ncbi:putative inorganic phosphate cotransporter [Trichogramma pretiosum]|uniref:putative inorganic phosphate cotransporter n=1 Tax=Trichogramma pretiosum TaxID=7493 RepID=UPI0006C93E7F|nr:putative inorganic phosphate cotransporter [Trichogramma pretiosum]XP_014235030.1 putative inorganic phosphate cotransporter [Trichogramma pretiosum]XP_014235031.1 putative inorganic phosphate cotransporter [Trichogramma pretiosum]XP_014235032.1 putative inorganic phosphate cotransporter [Trichogramma pretiosum]XP_014235033.1 putative inorganic phosphate cotransporter [Trichogramma pretiosum]XP_014235034.1 putative inorganic phosphate cotransporter [Trichogramma pretiosum]XP_023316612.1 pu
MGLYQRIHERIPRRAVLGSLMFFACMFSYVIRTNLSIIIVAMVSVKKEAKEAVCPIARGNSTHNFTGPAEIPDYGERYPWNQHIQGQLLAAYFYGTIPSSVPAGMLAERFGGARVVAFATLIPAVLNLFVPWAAGVHWMLVFALRFISGFFGSAVYPALHAMIARWVPPKEKGMFVWTMQGGPFGTFVTLSLCGLIIAYYGWTTAYYVTSGLMLIFYLLWVLLAYDTPDQHPTITEKERNYIKEQIGTSVSKQKHPLPIKSIATSLPFLALLFSHFANMWGIYFISTNGPKYTLEILGFDMKNAGALTGLPYIARLLAGVLFAAAGDYVRSKSLMSLGWMRRFFMLFSHVGPAISLLFVTYAGCDRYLAIAFMVLALTFNGAACQTNLQNHQDLAPNFAGSLYGIMNTFGSFSGFIIPAVIGALTNQNNGIEEWRVVFWISAVIFVAATALFWIFGSTEIQSWNDVAASKSKSANMSDEEKHINEQPKDEHKNEDDENAKL